MNGCPISDEYDQMAVKWWCDVTESLRPGPAKSPPPPPPTTPDVGAARSWPTPSGYPPFTWIPVTWIPLPWWIPSQLPVMLRPSWLTE